MKELHEKKKRFCEEYVKDFNAARAYRDAGYAAKDARINASLLLNKPEVQEYLSGLIGDIRQRNDMEVDAIVQELKKIAFADMADYWSEDNRPRPVHDIPKDARMALDTYQDDSIPTKSGTRKYRKIKLNSKLDAIEKLMRYFGAYEKDNKQKSELDLTTRSTDDLMAELAAIRARRTQNDEEE